VTAWRHVLFWTEESSGVLVAKNQRACHAFLASDQLEPSANEHLDDIARLLGPTRIDAAIQGRAGIFGRRLLQKVNWYFD